MRVVFSDIDRVKHLTRRNANPRTTDATPGSRELRRAQARTQRKLNKKGNVK